LELYGPTLLVDIGLDTDFRPGEATGPPSLPATRIKAIIDTAASINCIDIELALALKLSPVDHGYIGGMDGRTEVDLFNVQVYVPALEWTDYGHFAAVNLSASGHGHDVVLGRSFLRHWALVYEGATGIAQIIRSDAFKSPTIVGATRLPAKFKSDSGDDHDGNDEGEGTGHA